jgi:nicotinate-nucleotide pyrophosphorylase (carboxylating)
MSTYIERAVSGALREDVGAGDITASLIGESVVAKATVVSREAAVLCGQPWFNEVFAQLDSRVTIEWNADEGTEMVADQVVCRLTGPARSLLTGERTALNFLQTLSGTATIARQYSRLVAGTSIKVLDTRKTIPGLRHAQKYAAKIGGCQNHRMGLYDAFLIKENHIAACGGITAAVKAARKLAPGKPVEVEVENLKEYQEAMSAKADIIMLDNFTPELIRQAVAIKSPEIKIEISGNLDERTLPLVAIEGVDYLSSGSITKHCRAIDFSMRIVS